MLKIYSNPSHLRIPSPVPGVPESQARALDRRLRLHRQLQTFRMPRATGLADLNETSNGGNLLNEPGERVPA
jgi:hypothetical protein